LVKRQCCAAPKTLDSPQNYIAAPADQVINDNRTMRVDYSINDRFHLGEGVQELCHLTEFGEGLRLGSETPLDPFHSRNLDVNPFKTVA
jgi:hypothetical protein